MIKMKGLGHINSQNFLVSLGMYAQVKRRKELEALQAQKEKELAALEEKKRKAEQEQTPITGQSKV